MHRARLSVLVVGFYAAIVLAEAPFYPDSLHARWGHLRFWLTRLERSVRK